MPSHGPSVSGAACFCRESRPRQTCAPPCRPQKKADMPGGGTFPGAWCQPLLPASPLCFGFRSVQASVFSNSHTWQPASASRVQVSKAAVTPKAQPSSECMDAPVLAVAHMPYGRAGQRRCSFGAEKTHFSRHSGSRWGPCWPTETAMLSCRGGGQTVPTAGYSAPCFVSGLSLPMKATAMTSAWLALGVSMARGIQGLPEGG